MKRADLPREIIENSKSVLRETLERYEDAGVLKVDISTSGDERACESCRALETRGPYLLKDLIRDSTLPNRNCTTDRHEHSDFGFCRCCYIPVIE